MIHIVLGTKAQLIKMAPIMAVLRDRGIEYNFIVTGQHRETMSGILDNFSLRQPDACLYEGEDITGIGDMLVWCIKLVFTPRGTIRKLFRNDRRGIVLVHGDTFSTLLGAFLARRASLKVGHVESGLRSHNLLNPFPEEVVRLLTFRLTDYYFCPGDWAMANLERYRGAKINTQINTLYDALNRRLNAGAAYDDELDDGGSYAITTIHRFENIFNEKRFRRIIELILMIAERQRLLFILHLPTERQLKKYGLYPILEAHANVEMRPRYDYFDFIDLLEGARFVISDGGSNQEECFYLGIPVLLMRNASERTEGLGENCILSHYDEAIVHEFLENYEKHRIGKRTYSISPSEIVIDSCADFIEIT
ncbi:MAG: hypothetical protein C3L25_11955 [Candidatus Sedimenticola endophacoides]|nr:MAG: hypothetical protein B0D87_03705 [Candidatus Sedimenticola endophacoides]PUD98572.1 MAG: hypothetical protein C3L26_12045 [Candidatus Sedimenticola endophacoides]PUE01714.1 MAG: hypothetical protein C3L25_11955 [Candidatus Sedimenticola endophacoides]